MRIQRSSPYRSLTLVVALIILAVLLLLLDQSGRLGPLSTHAQSLIAPVLGGMRQVSDRVGSIGQGVGELQRLREENAAQQEEISRLKAENIESAALRVEYERLRQQLGMQQERPWKMVGGHVVAHSPDGGRHVMLLDIGADDNVKEGMAVIGQEGTSPPALIGVVEEVGPRSANVLLITDGTSAISVRVFHENMPFNGLAQGQWQRGSRLLLEVADDAAKIAPGDTVMTAGLTAELGLELPRAELPPNVPIGIVDAVRTDGPNQLADVRPYLDPNQVRYAWVILDHDG
jgi:rod shape-determining protein MreC